MFRGRVKAATAIAALCALLLAAAALAGTKTYRGAIKGDDESAITLKVKRVDGERALKLFAAEHFVISCESGPRRLERASLGGLIPVSGKGKFKVEGSDDERVLRLSGKLVGRRSAKGTVRYLGPTEVDGELESCDSGKLDWKASR